MIFQTKALPESMDAIAPDGSEVRVLLRNKAGSMAHFRLRPGQVSTAVRHRSIDEIWYFIEGAGELWRRQQNNHQLSADSEEFIEEIVQVNAGVCITIPCGTEFQLKAGADCALSAIGISSPPWPGDNDEHTEAVTVDGIWTTAINSTTDQK